MSRAFKWFLALVAIAFALSLAACTPKDMQGASVRVVISGAHGSATHIGGNVLLTAAHVVDGKTGIEIETADGKKYPAKVLWIAKEYDVAVLTYEGGSLPSADISCGALKPDTPVVAYGSPGPVRFARFAGKIATSAAQYGPWALVNVMDLTVWGGMSGGGVFDVRGRLVGVTVGLFSAPGMFGPAPSGISTMVPSSAICKMLGRG
jgi:serine protease Do